jgi:glycolate oxidase FAD binding subunit
MDLTSSARAHRLLEEVGARPPTKNDPTIDGLTPALVLEPGDAAACARAMALCHQETLALVPVGAGTRLSLGNPPSRLDVGLSMRGISGVDEHVSSDLTLAVRAGTSLGEVRDHLKAAGQFLPLDPPGGTRATIGGIMALGEPGFRRRPGARPRDLLLGFEGILPDGTIVRSGGRVVKNVAGYELNKLFVGSAGTLLVMTRAFLRLRAIPEDTRSLRIQARRPSEAAELWGAIHQLPFAPEVAAVLNPEHGRRHGIESWSLVLRFEGRREETDGAVEMARARCAPARCDEPPPGIWELLRDFPLGDETPLVLRGQAAPNRAIALADVWQDGGELVAYPDSGLVYSRTADLEALPDRQDKARLIGANVVIERAPTELKQEIDVFGESPESLSLMRRIKETMDPKAILSPGRFVGHL